MTKYHFVEPLPAPYQLEALKRALKLRRFGVFFQQRVGKTRVAIDYIGYSYTVRGIRRVLIGCPKTVRPVWVQQIREYLPEDVPAVVELDGKPYFINTWLPADAPPPTVPYGDVVHIKVANYEQIVNNEALLKKWAPQIVIADEAHLLKGATTKRSKVMWRLAKQASDRLALTGTPIPKRPTDAFGLGRFIADLWTKWTEFKERHMIINPYSRAVLGYKNENEISDALKPFSMRVLRKDTDIRDPEIEHITIPVELEPKARKIYNTLAREAVAELEDGSLVMAPHILTRMLRLQQIAGGFATREDGTTEKISEAKLDALVDLVQMHREAGEQVVVVGRFTDEILLAAGTLQHLEDGHKVHWIGGDTPATLRQAYIDWFKEGKCDVLVGQEKAISTGIDLSAARVMIFFSVDFSLDDFNQIKDRLMGRNQKADSVTYYYLTVKGSVDEYIYDTLRRDQVITSAVADKYREVLKPL